MEALRNYTQHRNFPVQSLSYPTLWEPPGAFENLVFRVRPFLDVRELDQDGSIKSRLMAELHELGEKVPLTPLVREYIEGIGAIHGGFRSQAKAPVEGWEAMLKGAIRRARDEFGGDKPGLAIVAWDEGGRINASEHLFEDFMKYRATLERKNGFLEKLSARYVSGSCPKRED